MSKIKLFIINWIPLIISFVVLISLIITIVYVVKNDDKDNKYKEAYYIRCVFNNDTKTTFYNSKYKIEDSYLYIKPENDEADLFMFSVDSCYIKFKED